VVVPGGAWWLGVVCLLAVGLAGLNGVGGWLGFKSG
jgi:hypothetical protein